MTSSDLGANSSASRIEDPPSDLETLSTSSPVIGDIGRSKRKSARFSKLKNPSQTAERENLNNGNNSSNKFPLKHLKKRLKNRNKRMSTSEKSSFPSSSTNSTAELSDAPRAATNQKKRLTMRHKVKRSSSAVSNKLRQSIKGAGVALMQSSRREPSLVPDMEKKVPTSIKSKITASLKHSRRSDGTSQHPRPGSISKELSVSSITIRDERRKKAEANLTTFSSDVYQPKTAISERKIKTKKKKKIPQDSASSSKSSHSLLQELLLDESRSNNSAKEGSSPFRNNSETEEVPLAGVPTKKKKKKRKKKVRRRARSATRASFPAAASSHDMKDEEEEDIRKTRVMMLNTKSEWKSERNMLKAAASSKMEALEKLFHEGNDTEDEEIYDSDDITFDGTEVPPHAIPTSPKQLQRATSIGRLFQQQTNSFSDSSDNDSSSSSYASETKELPNRPQLPLHPPLPPKRRFTTDPPKRHQSEPWDSTIDSTASKPPSLRQSSSPVFDEANDMMLSHHMELPPISPSSFSKKQPKKKSRIVSIDVSGSITPTVPSFDEQEEVTLRRSNSRERMSRATSSTTAPWLCDASSTSSSSRQPNASVKSPTSVRKAFKNPANLGGDLLQTPLVRKAGISSTNSSPYLVRKTSVISGAKSITAISKSANSSPVVPRHTSSISSNNNRRRQRSKSRDRERVHDSLRRASSSEYYCNTRLKDYNKMVDESPSSPCLEIQGSMEEFQQMIPPFSNCAKTYLSGDDDDDEDDIISQDGDVFPNHIRRTSNSKILRNLKKESQEKHQQHLERNLQDSSLLDVLDLATAGT